MNQREQQRAETRQRIIDAAMGLFDQQGFDATSMHQIAAASSTSRANLYLHFRSKPEIVLARMRQVEPEIRDSFAALDALPTHSLSEVRGWLADLEQMWRRHGTEFAAMEQAMATDASVADEWFFMMRRVSDGMTALESAGPAGIESRRAQMVLLMMSLERAFYYLFIRGHDDRKNLVLDHLARQGSELFAD